MKHKTHALDRRTKYRVSLCRTVPLARIHTGEIEFSDTPSCKRCKSYLSENVHQTEVGSETMTTTVREARIAIAKKTLEASTRHSRLDHKYLAEIVVNALFPVDPIIDNLQVTVPLMGYNQAPSKL